MSDMKLSFIVPSNLYVSFSNTSYHSQRDTVSLRSYLGFVSEKFTSNRFVWTNCYIPNRKSRVLEICYIINIYIYKYIYTFIPSTISFAIIQFLSTYNLNRTLSRSEISSGWGNGNQHKRPSNMRTSLLFLIFISSNFGYSWKAAIHIGYTSLTSTDFIIGVDVQVVNNTRVLELQGRKRRDFKCPTNGSNRRWPTADGGGLCLRRRGCAWKWEQRIYSR